MFKKAAEVKSQQRLSGADRKKIRRTVAARFANASDAHIDSLLPPKVIIIFLSIHSVCSNWWVLLLQEHEHDQGWTREMLL